jgi:hypothetical protein
VYGDLRSAAAAGHFQVKSRICRAIQKSKGEGYERVGRLWKEPVGGGAFAVVTRLIHRPRASSRFRGQEMPPKHRSGGGGLLLSHKTEASDRSSDEDGEITS